MRFFSGDYNAVNDENKRYLKVISRNDTQYLYAEFKFKNKVPAEWNCEVYFNWYNASGLLKARIERYRKVETDKVGEVITFNEGWGNDIPGTWKDNHYRLEIIFMDTVVAVLHLDTGEEDEDWDTEPITEIPAFDNSHSLAEFLSRTGVIDALMFEITTDREV